MVAAVTPVFSAALCSASICWMRSSRVTAGADQILLGVIDFILRKIQILLRDGQVVVDLFLLFALRFGCRVRQLRDLRLFVV